MKSTRSQLYRAARDLGDIQAALDDLKRRLRELAQEG